jgi:nucleolin
MSKAKATKNIDAMLSDDSSSEEVKPKKVATKAPAKKVVAKDSDDESSSEVELLKNKSKRPVEAKKEEKTSALPKAKVAAKKVESSDDESSEEVKPKAKAAPVKVAAKKVESSDDESSEEVKPKKAAPVKVAAKKAESSDEESSEEETKVVAKPIHTPKAPESDCAELFCKNLSWNTDENILGEFFGKYGEVTNVKVLYDKMTGKARGLAFVAFSSRAEAQKALDDAANLEIDSRLIQVSFSDQKPERPAFGAPQAFGGNNRSFGGQNNYNQDRPQRSNFEGERHTAFVGNLGFKTNEGSVRKFFSDCGNVVDVRIAKNEEGRSKGFCHVDFDSNDAVEKAKTKAGQDLDGREIRVDSSTPRQGGGDRGGRGGFRGGRGGDRGGRGGFRGGRGGFGGNPMDRAKKSGAIISNPNAVMTFDDDE